MSKVPSLSYTRIIGALQRDGWVVVLKNVKPGRSSDAIDRIKAGMGDMIIATDIVRQFSERGFLISDICDPRGKKFLMGRVGV